MYKYFKELDKPNNYHIYLNNKYDNKDDIYHINNISINNIFINKEFNHDYKLLNSLINGMNINLPLNYMTYEEYELFYDFFNFRDDDDLSYYNDNSINIVDFIYQLDKYTKLANYLIDFFPEYKNEIIKAQQNLKNIVKEYNSKSQIIIEKNKTSIHTLPNAWFITLNGYLYNTGGSNGHKEGNLIYPFFYIIKKSLDNNQEVPNIENLKQIKNILNRGFVSQSEFQRYANLIDELPTIKTAEVELEEKKYQRIISLSIEEFKKIKKEDLPTPKRSYQRNILNLVVGHLSAEDSLYKSFIKLNNSDNKKEHIKKIADMTNLYIPDILVRYSGFHKIESQVNKTITTSSINKIDEFKDYLDKGWQLQLIPGIIYDEREDIIEEMNFNSYYIDQYLENKQKEYDGKILIKR